MIGIEEQIEKEVGMCNHAVVVGTFNESIDVLEELSMALNVGDGGVKAKCRNQMLVGKASTRSIVFGFLRTSPK